MRKNLLLVLFALVTCTGTFAQQEATGYFEQFINNPKAATNTSIYNYNASRSLSERLIAKRGDQLNNGALAFYDSIKYFYQPHAGSVWPFIYKATPSDSLYYYRTYSKYKIVNDYDAQGNLTAYQEYLDSAGITWQYRSRNEYYYDANNRPVYEVHYNFNSSTVPYGRSTLTYNADDLVTEYLMELWTVSTSTWRPLARYLYTYTNYQVATRTYETMNNNVWTPRYRETYMYNTDNDMVEYAFQKYANSTWPDSLRTQNVYDLSHHLQIATNQKFTSGSWKNVDRHSYAYLSNDSVQTDDLDVYTAGSWQPQGKTVYAFDINNIPTGYTYQQRVGNQWQNKVRVTGTNTPLGHQLTRFTEQYVNNAWADSMWQIYYYEDYEQWPTQVQSPVVISHSLTPNPAHDVAYLVTDLATNSNAPANITLTDMLGKTVLNTYSPASAGTNTFAIDLSALPPGIYIYTLTTNQGNTSGKLIKQ